METSRKRGLVRIACAVLFVACVGLLYSWVLLQSTDPITEANCRRIKRGMTEDEVSTILGGSPKQIVYADSQGNYGVPPPTDGKPRRTARCWWQESPSEARPWVHVGFNSQGRVEWARFENSWRDRLRRWLKHNEWKSWLRL
jgi:hypothetical protein